MSKAHGTKRGAVSLAPNGGRMHKTCALRHSLRWRTLESTDLHYPDFTPAAPPAYPTNCHYSHLSEFWEFCTRQQYEKFWRQDNATLLLANDFVCAWKTHLEGQGDSGQRSRFSRLRLSTQTAYTTCYIYLECCRLQSANRRSVLLYGCRAHGADILECCIGQLGCVAVRLADACGWRASSLRWT